MADLRKYKPYRELFYLLPPLLVYFFAGILFELSVDPAVPVLQNLVAMVKANTTHDLSHSLIELKARYVWLALVLLNINIAAASIIISLMTIKSYVRHQHLALTVGIAVLLCLGNFGYMLYSAHVENAFYELIFGFTYKMLTGSGMFSNVFLTHIYVIILVINIFASVVPVALLLALCATLHLPPPPCHLPPVHLARRIRRLKEIINFASAFLVFGILHMSMWLNWTASLVNDPELRLKIAGVAWSISAYWGVAFTLVLTATYFPSTIYLHHQVLKQITKGKEAMAPKEAEQWLNEHGFSFTFNNQLTQCISILAPILTAPISSVLQLD